MSLRRPLASLFILLISAIWILVSAVDPSSARKNQNSAPQKGFLAPDFTLETPDGRTITLSELEGDVVLINLWASWCGPCRAEMPAIERVYQDYKDRGLSVLAVNATHQDSVDTAVSFAQSLSLSFPILLDPQGTVSRAYQLQALPSTYFLDRNGEIQEIVIGGPMSEALLRARVQTLLENDD